MKRTAIVTGGGRGIGLAIAKKLGEQGANIVIFSSGGEEKYKDALSALTGRGIEWLYVQGSVAALSDHAKLIERTLERFGRIDILINNAGVAPKERRDLLEMTPESYDRVMDTNTRGPLFLTQAVSRQMLKQAPVGGVRGHIVFIGSCSAAVSSVSRGEYCVSKAGVSMLTTLFADRLAGEGIFVNEVRPGVIATDMTAAVTEKYDRLIAEGAFPIRRWGTPEDVANAAAWFCSPETTYTTGNYIDVDGGFHIKRL